MENKNVFMTAKGYYETTFSNLERYYGENEKMINTYMEESENEDSPLKRDYDEWLGNAKKALADYRDLVMKGLDYLSYNLEKDQDRPFACAS
jgi:hypothetical protein